jgi:multiple sugar transport system ATP-binding protein
MNTLIHGHIGNHIAITGKLRGWKDYAAGEIVRVRLNRKHFFDKATTNAIRREGV